MTKAEGRVIAYSDDVRAGYLMDSEGQKHFFSKKDWLDEDLPRSDQKIFFVMKGGRPQDITARKELDN